MDPNISGISDTSMDVDSNSATGPPGTPGTPSNIFSFSTALSNSASASLQKRRSSTRSIKRKKFDDELVESSLAKTDRTRIKLPAFPSSGSFSCSLPGTPVVTTPLTPGADSATTTNPIGMTIATTIIPETDVTQSTEQISGNSSATVPPEESNLAESEKTPISVLNPTPTTTSTAITASNSNLGSSESTTLSSVLANTITSAVVSQSPVPSTPTPPSAAPVHTKKKKVPTATLR